MNWSVQAVFVCSVTVFYASFLKANDPVPMKPFGWILVGSALVNALLATALVVRQAEVTSTRSEESRTGNRIPAEVAASKHGREQAGGETLADSVAASLAQGDVWGRTDTDDLPTLVARLKFIGIPSTLVRSIVTARVQDQFAERRKAVVGNVRASEYWKVGHAHSETNRKSYAALRDLMREESALINSLVGEDYGQSTWIDAAQRKNQYGNLDPAKAEQLQQLLADYREMEAELREQSRVYVLPEDARMHEFLESEKRRDIEAFLTPEEIADWDLRSSRTAYSLRNRLHHLEISEEQYRRIFTLQKQFDDTFRPVAGRTNSSSTPEYRAAEDALEGEIATVLGVEAAAAFKKSGDYTYRHLAGLVRRLGLAADTPQKIDRVQEAFNESISGFASLQGAERQQRVRAAQEAASAQVEALLGSKAALTLYQDSIGFWLRAPVSPAVPNPGPR